MATMTKSVSGLVTTYVITDNEAATCTIAFTSTAVTGLQMSSITNSGNFHGDGEQMLAQLLLQTATGLLP